VCTCLKAKQSILIFIVTCGVAGLNLMIGMAEDSLSFTPRGSETVCVRIPGCALFLPVETMLKQLESIRSDPILEEVRNAIAEGVDADLRPFLQHQQFSSRAICALFKFTSDTARHPPDSILLETISIADFLGAEEVANLLIDLLNFRWHTDGECAIIPSFTPRLLRCFALMRWFPNAVQRLLEVVLDAHIEAPVLEAALRWLNVLTEVEASFGDEIRLSLSRALAGGVFRYKFQLADAASQQRLCEAVSWVVPSLRKDLQHGCDASVRVLAAEALEQLGSATVASVRELGLALYDPEHAVRAAALCTLKRLGTSAVTAEHEISFLVVNDCDPTLRKRAIDVLAECGTGLKTVNAVCQALSDSEGMVRDAAARALGQLGGIASSALPELEKVMTCDSKSFVRISAEEAYYKVRGASNRAPLELPTVLVGVIVDSGKKSTDFGLFAGDALYLWCACVSPSTGRGRMPD